MAMTTLLFTILTLLLAAPAAAHSFPYVPTQVLMPDPMCVDGTMPCAARDLAYIFRQTASGSVEFRGLNFSSSLDADEPDLEQPAGRTALPFLEGEPKSTAFSAARTANGSVLVYSGDCRTGSGDVWSFDPEETDEWVRRDLGVDGDHRRAPYFLGGTVAFSSILAPSMEQPTLYTYGGMCAAPSSESDAAESWQADANYTKSMLGLEPDNNDAQTPYTLSVASSGGPRTPIAGFTLTGLTPSMTNKSGLVTQQMSYVLLGGHTESAFINMSTVAVWNLPAESWTYVNIQPPNVDIPKTDLAVKDTNSNPSRRSSKNTADNVYSRSGHTATLSEDGTSIVILGGWVGDVSTPAEPQLAVLEMSEAYSGWQWKIPDEQPDFGGVYGHGAAILPGNMLMTYGGWEISSSSSSSKTKRQAVSGTLRLYNLTSGSWETSYNNPLAGKLPPLDNDAPKKSGDMSDSKRLGLGLGLGFGLAILIGIVIATVCWCKRRKRHRENRDQAVRALSQDASNFSAEHDEMMERDDDPWGTTDAPWYGAGADPYAAGERSLGYESLRGNRGGVMAGALPGLHIPQKSSSRPSRGGYVPTGPRPGSFPGPIHPIYEDDEEENYHHHRMHDAHTPTSEVPSDPFQTPVATSHPPPPLFLIPGGGRASATPSPESPRHDPEVQDWVTEVDAAEGLLARMNSMNSQHRSHKPGAQNQGQGRVSPTRRNSNRSAALRDDESRSGSNLSESARSAADSIKAKARQLNPLAPAFLAAGAEHPKPGSSSSSSYNTARSSFGVLQAEGPALLMGDRAPRHDDEEPSSPSKSKPRRGWLGSLRRVFSGSSTPTSFREDMGQDRRSFDQEPISGDYEPGLVGLRGELLRRKQGRHDWEDGDFMPASSRDVVMSGGAGLEPGGESDWDIEKAVEQRLVQVMFTVPRERLRVVNGNDEDGERDDEVPVKPQAAVIVDPEKESQRSRADSIHEKGAGREVESPELGRHGEAEETDEKMANKQHPDPRQPEHIEDREDDEPQKRQQPQPPQEQHQSQPSPQQLRTSHLQPIQPLFHHQPPSASPSPTLSPSPSPHLHPNTSRHARGDSSNSFSFLHQFDPLEPRFSHSTDDTGRRSSGVVMEAQAMPLTRERPRATRVLAMVDSFESLSREGSPTRGSA
ncbi:hypothetical protein FZEAL_4101 [Fusarium zealandicum]|uniref:Galactose oxidase n=1 Tax=Fusarium zealandicum TaxID=1053134 RepID=A0A8H4UN23_9HYPO|nr:hypothetical protein FZEAL_4101 [Fusarium zealandicum]